jgi:hypothetical protein
MPRPLLFWNFGCARHQDINHYSFTRTSTCTADSINLLHDHYARQFSHSDDPHTLHKSKITARNHQTHAPPASAVLMCCAKAEHAHLSCQSLSPCHVRLTLLFYVVDDPSISIYSSISPVCIHNVVLILRTITTAPVILSHIHIKSRPSLTQMPASLA